MSVEIERTLPTEADTEAFAKELAPLLWGGISIGLKGELGAGKTTFSRFLLKALGSKDSVSSPSFVLEQVYQTAKGLEVEHWDLYRLSGLPEELMEPSSNNTIRLVEWPNKVPEFEKSMDLLLEFSYQGDSARLLTINSSNEALLEGLCN